MADNYFQFSMELPTRSPEQQAWRDRIVAFVDDELAGLYDLELANNVTRDEVQELADEARAAAEANPADTDAARRAALLADAADFYTVWSDLDDWECPGYQISAEDSGVWMWSEEGGDAIAVARVCQDYLTRFDPNGHVTFTWAETCSAMRVDEFSGGGIHITADRFNIFDAYQFAVTEEERRQALAAATDSDRADWTYEVANGDTERGFADWLVARAEANSAEAA